MKQMNIGSYYPVATYLHEIDARVKVVATVMIITLLFFSSSFWSYGLIACFLVGLTFSAKLPIKLTSGIYSLRFILILTFLLSALMTPGEEILFQWSWLYATVEGIHIGSVIIIRIILMIFTTTVLTMTTTAFSLTSTLEFLFSPLKKLRLPVAEGALMINLALRFIPTLIEEKDRIMNSQKARGASFEVDGILQKARSIIPVLIPLIISSFKRADDLALAMEARCFKIRGVRTNYRAMQMRREDYLALLVMVIFFVSILAFELGLKHIL